MSHWPQSVKAPKKFSLGPLGTLNQVIKAMGKTQVRFCLGD